MTSEHHVIRPMQSADLERVLSWRNHPEVRRFMYSQQEITPEQHHNWFEQCQKNPSKTLLIFEKDHQPCGFTQFTQSAPGIAEWGFYTAPDALAGTGTLLGRAALHYGFSQLKLHKVCGQALDFNSGSIRFHLKMGFKQEGVLRDQHYDGQHYHSIICFGLLQDEWLIEHASTS